MTSLSLEIIFHQRSKMRISLRFFFYNFPIVLEVELEWVPDPAQRPGPEEKLAVKKPDSRF